MCIFDSSNAKPETPLMDILYWLLFRMRVIGRCDSGARVSQKTRYTGRALLFVSFSAFFWYDPFAWYMDKTAKKNTYRNSTITNVKPLILYSAIHLSWMKSIFTVWDLFEPPWEHLLMPYANNKDADQPAHMCSLSSAFVVRCLDSIIPPLAIAEISRL